MPRYTIQMEVIGDAVELAALGSARSKTDEYYNQTHHQTHFGHVQAILRAGYKPGAATIRVNAEGYVTNEFVVNVR